MKRARGFTLIELMIVVAIVAVLATLALGAYGKQVRKSKRAEAKQVLSDLSLREEKYRASNALYATCDQAFSPTTCANMNLTFTNYTISVSNVTGTTYTLTAVPKTTDQAKDICGTLTYAMSAGVITKSPLTNCW